MWKGLVLSVFHPMVLAFIDDPFLNQLLEWWLQNGGISITELANDAISWLNLLSSSWNVWLTDIFSNVLLVIQLPLNDAYSVLFFFKCCALYPLFSKICAASLQSRIHSGFTTAGISGLETCPRVRVQTYSINHFVILSPSNNDTLFYYSSLTLDVTFTADQWGSKWAMLIIPAGQWQHSDVWLNKQPWVWPTWDQGFLEFRLVEFILMVHVLCILQTIQCFGFNNW